MMYGRYRSPLVPVALLALLGGCAANPAPEPAVDTRLNQLASNMDKSLANQATVDAQLREQQRQLESQQQQLQALSENLGRALRAPAARECPKPVACPPPVETSGKMLVGALEEVWLTDLDVALTARIDTGASTSSLDARNIELFERDGKSWVRFDIINPKTGKPMPLERRLKRTIGIHQAGSAEVERRPVVKMGIVIGQSEQTAEFSLADRSHVDYQVLIGRNILQDVMVVDVSKKNVAPYQLPEKTAEGKDRAP